MEILRVPSYSSTVTINVSSASTEYTYSVLDMTDLSVSQGTVTSNSSYEVTIDLPSTYDSLYEVSIDGEVYSYEIVRPYSNPNDHGTTATEIADYAKNEEIARAIIDSVIPEGFYFKKAVIETVGLGNDYMPLWMDVKKVLKVYENNVLVFDADNPSAYDRTFEITQDKTAIVQVYNEAVNRIEGSSVIIPMAASDSGAIEYYSRTFPKGADYKFIVEAGYRKIPSDIVKAADYLVDDISCGKLEYYRRYVTDYNTDQFRIKFDKASFEGTGNIVVDKILSKYAKSIRTIGVL